MKNRAQPLATIPFEIADEECVIEVEEFESVPAWGGLASSCPSSDDFYGYIECSYSIAPARLEDAITIKIDNEILELIKEEMQ